MSSIQQPGVEEFMEKLRTLFSKLDEDLLEKIKENLPNNWQWLKENEVVE